jgi:hypothetical protein
VVLRPGEFAIVTTIFVDSGIAFAELDRPPRLRTTQQDLNFIVDRVIGGEYEARAINGLMARNRLLIWRMSMGLLPMMGLIAHCNDIGPASVVLPMMSPPLRRYRIDYPAQCYALEMILKTFWSKRAVSGYL